MDSQQTQHPTSFSSMQLTTPLILFAGFSAPDVAQIVEDPRAFNFGTHVTLLYLLLFCRYTRSENGKKPSMQGRPRQCRKESLTWTWHSTKPSCSSSHADRLLGTRQRTIFIKPATSRRHLTCSFAFLSDLVDRLEGRHTLMSVVSSNRRKG